MLTGLIRSSSTSRHWDITWCFLGCPTETSGMTSRSSNCWFASSYAICEYRLSFLTPTRLHSVKITMQDFYAQQMITIYQSFYCTDYRCHLDLSFSRVFSKRQQARVCLSSLHICDYRTKFWFPQKIMWHKKTKFEIFSNLRKYSHMNENPKYSTF